MDFLAALWLPIIVSTILVVAASMILHIVLGEHRNDFQSLPQEDRVMASLREAGVKPGQYTFPRAPSRADMGDQDMMVKYEHGPVGTLIVTRAEAPRMGFSQVEWAIFSMVVGLFSGYVSWIAFGAGAPYMQVFRVTGTVAILGYGVVQVLDSIWRGLKWSTSLKYAFDGVIYGLLTAGTFGWLWPEAVPA